MAIDNILATLCVQQRHSTLLHSLHGEQGGWPDVMASRKGGNRIAMAVVAGPFRAHDQRSRAGRSTTRV